MPKKKTAKKKTATRKTARKSSAKKAPPKKKNTPTKRVAKKSPAKKSSGASRAPSRADRSSAVRSFSRSTPTTVAASGSWHFQPRKPGDRWYWLLKQEPSDFSFDDLLAKSDRTTNWNGVRNFLARKFLRDQIKAGDYAFYYHSNADPSAAVGIVEIVRDGYPDESAFDSKSPYYDGDTSPESPTWFQVDVRAVEKLPRPVSIAEMRSTPALAGLVLLHISQLSVQPVTKAEWDAIVELARRETK